MNELSAQVQWCPDHETVYVKLLRGAFPHEGNLSAAEMKALAAFYSKLATIKNHQREFAKERKFELFSSASSDSWFETDKPLGSPAYA